MKGLRISVFSIGSSSINNPYTVVNWVFIFLISLIFLYSIIFYPDNYPIPPLLSILTEEIPPSKGLSIGFSEVLRGNFQEALNHNPYSIRIFSFFAIQLIIRFICLMALYYSRFRHSIIAFVDTILSTALFIWCFYPLISYTLLQFYKLTKGLG